MSSWNCRVRGGSSTSSLTSLEDGRRVLFHGHLDTTTLGGAGFASQRTIPGLNWNLGGKQGLLLRISNADGMRYVPRSRDRLILITNSYSLNLKTEESGTSSAVEYKFFFDTLMNQSTEFEIPWSKFVPFFRGREQNNAPALDPSNIQSMSIMCASGFDTQKGDYALTVESISVY